MAVAMDVGVPWIMCKQTDAPDPVVSSCNCLDITVLPLRREETKRVISDLTDSTSISRLMHAMEGTVVIPFQAPTNLTSLLCGLKTGLLSKYIHL